MIRTEGFDWTMTFLHFCERVMSSEATRSDCFEGFYKIGDLKIFAKFTAESLSWYNCKIKACHFNEKETPAQEFTPINFTKFLGTPFSHYNWVWILAKEQKILTMAKTTTANVFHCWPLWHYGVFLILITHLSYQ